MPASPLEVVVRSEDGSSLAVHRLDPGTALLAMRPIPCEATLSEVEGQFVLSTPDRKVYLRLSADQARMWKMIDGKSTIAEIVTAWFITVGSLDVGRVLGFMQLLRRTELIEAVPVGFLRSRLQNNFALREWRWIGIHAMAEATWRVVGGMFTGWTLPIWFTTVALGGWALNTETRALTLGLSEIAPIVLLSGIAHIAIHEFAHALAVVAAGRKVRHLGIGFGGIYVDTTDLYLGSRSQHAVAALAGPATNIVIAGLLATFARAATGYTFEVLWAASATGAALALLTGWPFLLENDGYRAFCDFAGEPHLRRAGWRSVMAGKASPAQMMYSIGGILTIALAAVVLILNA